MTVIGGPAYTLSRGRVVYDKGQLNTERGTGRYVNRPCFAPYWTSQKTRNRLAEPTAVDRSKS